MEPKMIPTKKKLLPYDRFDSLLVNDSVSDFMTTPPITLRADACVDDAKSLMRDHRISGIPIVDDEEVLIGLISLENIIIALEENLLEDPISRHMVQDVVFLTDDMDVSHVIEFFMTYQFGRYPVVDKYRTVVGVVTHGDLILHMLERLGNVYLHDRRREEAFTKSKHLLTPGTFTTKKSFSFRIDSPDLDDAGKGATLFKKFLQKEGVPTAAIRRASIALYEAEVNVVLHAYGKGHIRASADDGHVFIMVSDDGPGIDDIEKAMQPGYTTASDEVRERGFGAGMGLDNIKKYTDKLIILSSESGLKMEMVIMVEEQAAPK